MVTILVIGGFFGMLLAPCVIAARAGWEKSGTVPTLDPLAPKSEDAVDGVSPDAGKLTPYQRKSSQMKAIKLTWNHPFDSGEDPRAARRNGPVRRRV